MTHIVEMHVVGATGLKEVQKFGGKSTPHVVVLCNDVEKARSAKAEKTLSPTFNFDARFEVAAPPHQHILKIRVMSKNSEMGNCELPLGQVLLMTGLDQVLDHKMQLDCGKSKPQGEISFRVRVNSEGTRSGTPLRGKAPQPQTPTQKLQGTASAGNASTPRSSPASSPAQSPSASPAHHTAPHREVDPAFRDRVVRFYTEYNPQKLQGVDNILQKYPPEELMAKLVKQYGPEPESPSPSPSPSPGPREAEGAPVDPQLRARVVRFYQKYNPQKVANVDSILQKYGTEGFIEKLVSQYGPEPGEGEGEEEEVQRTPEREELSPTAPTQVPDGHIEAAVVGRSSSPAQAPSPTSTQHSSPRGHSSPRKEDHMHIINKYYKKHDPVKLQVTKVLLEKTYQGDGEAMIKQLARKWGPEPDTDAEDSEAEQETHDTQQGAAQHETPAESAVEVSDHEHDHDDEEEHAPEHEDTTDELSGVVARQRSQLQQFAQKSKEMHAENNELLRLLEASRREAQDAPKERQHSQQDLDEAILAAILPVKMDLDAAQRELDQKSTQLEDLTLEMQQHDNNNTTNSDTTALQEELSAASARIEELLGAASDAELALETANERVAEVEAELKEMRAERTRAEKQAATGTADNTAALSEEVQQLSVALAEKDEEMRMSEEVMSSRLREAEERVNTLQQTQGEERIIERQQSQPDLRADRTEDMRRMKEELTLLEAKLQQETTLVAQREEEVKAKNLELDEREEVLQYKEASQDSGRQRPKETKETSEEQKRLQATQEQLENQKRRMREKEQELAEKESAMAIREEEHKIVALEMEKRRLSDTDAASQDNADAMEAMKARYEHSLEQLREMFGKELAEAKAGAPQDTEHDSTDLKARVADLERAHAVLNDERSALVAEKTELEVANNLLTQEKVQTEDRLALAERLEVEEGRHADLEADNQRLRAEVAAVNAEVAAKGVDLEALEEKLAACEAELAKAADTPKAMADEAVRQAAQGADLDQREKVLQEAEDTHAAKAEHIKDLELEMETQQTLLEALRHEADTATQTVATKQVELAQLDTALASQQHILEEKQQTVELSLASIATREEELLQRESDVEERDIMVRSSVKEAARKAQQMNDQEENLRFREDELQASLRELDTRTCELVAAAEREVELRARSEEMRVLLDTVRRRALLLDDRSHAAACREETLDTTERRLELRASQLKEQEYKLQLLGSISHSQARQREQIMPVQRERDVAFNRKDDGHRKREKELQQALTMKDKQLQHVTQQISRSESRKIPGHAQHAKRAQGFEARVSPGRVRVALDLDADVSGPAYMKGTASSTRRSVSGNGKPKGGPASPRLSLENAVQSLTCTLDNYEDFLQS